ncbi:MAG: GNAT family N-acetyltransferase [Candidatus Melainabacteria bacterium]
MLTNPIWQALTSHQQALAQGDTLARAFPASISPLAGIAHPSPEAFAALAALPDAERVRVLFMTEAMTDAPEGWQLTFGGPLVQMSLTAPDRLSPLTTPPEGFTLHTLTLADVPEMLALTQLTEPGPFETDTITLGRYIGLRTQHSGQLAAMAGERLRLPGYREVSAVCTHPDFQGQGLAALLISDVARSILARGETPFLHAWHANTGAIRLYEKLGFTHSNRLHVAALQLQPQAIPV